MEQGKVGGSSSYHKLKWIKLNPGSKPKTWSYWGKNRKKATLLLVVKLIVCHLRCFLFVHMTNAVFMM